MITLVDDHAAIVKSADGRALASQPRDLSFCGRPRSRVTRAAGGGDTLLDRTLRG